MRRLLLLALLVPATIWLFAVAWISCGDDYRDVLPLRGYDAAPRDLTGRDLTGPIDDLSRPNDLSDGAMPGDAATPDGGMTDGGMTDGGSVDGMTG
jgi:hypothetical protein